MSPKLSYIAVVSRDVAASAALLEGVLGLTRTQCRLADGRSLPTFAVGEAAITLVAPGDAFVGGEERAGVHHIGLTVADRDAYAAHLKQAGVGVAAAAEPGLGNTPRLALDPSTTAGVRAYLVEPLAIARSASRWIERIDHIGIASADNRAAISVFSGTLGVPVESQQTDMEIETAVESFTSDTYGVVYHSRAPKVLGGLRVAFLTVGDCELEFLQNFDPSHGAQIQHGASGNTRQDQGAITRFIETRGAGLHHIALKSPDINGTLAALGAAGATLIDTRGRPGSRRALIGFIHPRTFGGVLFHVVERD